MLSLPAVPVTVVAAAEAELFSALHADPLDQRVLS